MDDKKLNNLLRIIVTLTSDLECECITAHGRKGDLAYVVFGTKDPKLYLLDTSTFELEKPEVRFDDWSNTYWDSRNHGLDVFWKTKHDVLHSIAAAYELMDHKKGDREEWYAEPYDFAKDGALLERLWQPGYNNRYTETHQNNATLLVGRLGNYGLKIDVGGKGWIGGFSDHGLEEAVALMKLYSEKPEDR